MAKVVITAVAGKNYFKIDFGDKASDLGVSYRLFWPDDISLIDTDGHVTVSIKGGVEQWHFSVDGVGKTLQVDSVLGSEPSDNNDLATKIADLKG